MREVAEQTLYVVATELATTLAEARAALERYAEVVPGQELSEAAADGSVQPNDLLLCAELLHAVHGVLRVVEVHGAALLVEEMEQVCRHFVAIKPDTQSRLEGLDALVRAMAHLPTYLERVLAGGRDLALVLLPLLNDLRAVRGHPLLSEGTLLLLNLTSDIQPKALDSGPDGAVITAQIARRLRPQFQAALLGVIRGENAQARLEALSTIANEIERVATKQSVFQLWWVIGALIEALRDAGVEATATVKRLLGTADRELKKLYELGEVRYAEAPPVSFLNNLLFYISRSRSNGERVTAVRTSFGLQDLLPVSEQIENERENLSAPSLKLMETVGVAIKQDLSRVKDVLDIFVRKGSTDTAELVIQLEMLRKISDTLGVLGLGDLRAKVQQQLSRFGAMIDGSVLINDAALVEIAANLITVEDNLDAQLVRLVLPRAINDNSPADDPEFSAVRNAVLRECIVNLARVKESISLIVIGGETGNLVELPDLLSEIKAGLGMLERVRAAQIVAAISVRVASLAAAPTCLTGTNLDRLADSIVSIEYYMETLQSGRSDPWYMLDNAERCLAEIPLTTDGQPSYTDVKAVGTAVQQALIDTKPLPTAEAQHAHVDVEIVSLFVEEAREELAVIDELLPYWDANPLDQDALIRLRRAFHTLKGSGRMVGARALAEFAWTIESLLNRVLSGTLSRSSLMLSRLREAVTLLPQLIHDFEHGVSTGIDVRVVSNALEALSGTDTISREDVAELAGTSTDTGLVVGSLTAPPSFGGVNILEQDDSQADVAPVSTFGVAGTRDVVLDEIYRREVLGHLRVIRAYQAECAIARGPYRVTEHLYRACHTLAGASSMAENSACLLLTEPLDNYLRKLYDHQLTLSSGALEVLVDVATAIDQLIAGDNVVQGAASSADQLLARLHLFSTEADRDIAARGLKAATTHSIFTEDSAEVDQKGEDQFGTGFSGTATAAVDFDPDIAMIFSEEATELLDSAERALEALRARNGDLAKVSDLKRALHTLKGGARMAGISAMGDLAHELESLFSRAEIGDLTTQDDLIVMTQTVVDALNRMRDTVSAGNPAAPADALVAQLRTFSSGVRPAASEATSRQVDAEIAPKPPRQAAVRPSTPVEVMAVASLADEARYASVAPGREAGAPQDRQELARVDAELLDTLLDGAGEVSIHRARLEQQLSSIELNLVELGRVVLRLKAQLRNMELETEAQILHRHQDDGGRRDDFDPLEMDRYSLLQQYSRALAESTSDVASVQGLLEVQTREAQNLLMQQARVVTDLQNGLMRTRMVPFQRHVARLTRLVRQLASETGRKVDLFVNGASGELDRQVLERMLPPFEHMLRNAVVHGIESPAERHSAGKDETGRIDVSLHREGAEVVIVVSDDGRGINMRAVREKALALGLVNQKQSLSDQAALQLILEPGFSTADSLTQTAGRGVGMDVVATEVKRLGGVLQIDSAPGRGTRFTVRLPFALAISQALIVRTDSELYALPLPTVEAVLRLSKSEVERHLASETASFTYSGQAYRFQHLGRFIGAPLARFPDSDVLVPVVLIRAGESSTALVMDELVGSREIVVKNVGPVIAAIRGIAGATILGDGRIVVILDMGSLVRGEWRTRPLLDSEPSRPDRRVFALVVDDSITVRRVTQRLLERNGMRVMTAKDGVDALTILQEHVPDIILLDIEMPRMDGYEVAARVRADERLRNVPIVMITSRVGEKHRARAIELGVNDYLGKPYQENQLLDAIGPLVAKPGGIL
jgi:chemosensory pili system protein ChpA (sensor histidine kinase/response regulator)